MLRKLSVVLSVVAALGLAAAVSAPADAKEVKNVHVNKSVNVQRNVTINRNVRVNKDVRVNRDVRRGFVVGKRYHGHVWYGQNRHRWHGRWYDYGVGPCWINVDGLWFWNVVACPP